MDSPTPPSPSGAAQDGAATEWAARKGLAWLISAATFVVPVVISVGAAVLIVHLIREPTSTVPRIGWWALVVLLPWPLYVAVGRVARRALPLAALYQMTLVFPDKAPSRMAVARRAGSTRALERQLHEAEVRGSRDGPSVAAEQILALAASLSRHDRLTRGHSERVRVLTDLIAGELKLSVEDRNRLRWAALLHDIGKTAVPGSVLNKPGKLVADEWEMLRRHPEEGARLTAPLADWLGPWAATVAQHHERYDGTGYPLGIRGEDISLGGRVVAVADSYEVMTAVRSYKRAMSPEQAREELARCAGSHFDPVVVRAFLEASVGRLSVVGGPLAALADVVANATWRLGNLAGGVSSFVGGAAMVAGVGAAAVGGLHHPPVHLSVAAPAATWTTPTRPPVTSPRPTNTTAPHKTSPHKAPTRHVEADPPSTAGSPAGGIKPTHPGNGASRTSNPTPTPGNAPGPAPVTTTTTPATTTTTPATTTTPSDPTTTSTSTTALLPPGPPTGVAPADGNGEVTLSWSPPASDGGASVTSYTATADTGQSCTVTASAGSLPSCTITGLTNGDSYTFFVTATNSVGTGPRSAVSRSVVPSTVPGAPTIGAVAASNASASVSWTVPSSDGGSAIIGYVVTPYVGSTAQAVEVVSSPATTKAVTGLTNGTAYTFTVAAINANGAGAASAPSSSVVPSTVPGAPTMGAVAASNASASVSWTAPSDNGGAAITGYVVTPYVGFTAQSAQTFASTATTQTVTGLDNGTAYLFKVAAVNATGTGVQSAASNSVTPYTVPGSPTIGAATASNASASVTWSAPTDNGGSVITGYVVTPYIGTLAQSAQTFMSAATTETVTGLTNGTAYTFQVAAINAAGTGAQSEGSNSVTPYTVPGAPTIGSATAATASASLSWTAPSNNGGSVITGYVVTPYIGVLAQSAQTFSSAATTETVTGLTDGSAYTFQVAAINAAGTGAPSAGSNSVTPSTVPGAPTIGAATASNASASVTWSAPTDNGGAVITGYVVTPYVGTLAQTTQAFSSTATTQTVTGLTNGTTYTFTVAAVNANGTGPASTPSSSVVPSTVPGAPTSVTAIAGNASATVSWSPPTDFGGLTITSYVVTASGDGGNETCVDNVIIPEVDSCTVTGLTNGTAYTFQVVAVNLLGSSSASAPSAAVTPTAVTSSLTIANATGNVGRPDQGDTITVVYSTPPDPSTFCSLWSSGSTPTLSGSQVVVTGGQTSGDDEITSVSDSSCSSGFNFGTIDLGQTGYFNTTVTFTGSTITWTDGDTLTITLGTPSIGDPTQGAPSVAIYTPAPALGISGTIDSPNEVQF